MSEDYEPAPAQWERVQNSEVSLIVGNSPSGRPTRENRGPFSAQHASLADPPAKWELITERVRRALMQLKATVDTSPDRMGGALVLKGTRFKVSQLFAELADSDAVEEVAEEFEIDAEQIRDVLHAVAVSIDRSLG